MKISGLCIYRGERSKREGKMVPATHPSVPGLTDKKTILDVLTQSWDLS